MQKKSSRKITKKKKRKIIYIRDENGKVKKKNWIVEKGNKTYVYIL